MKKFLTLFSFLIFFLLFLSFKTNPALADPTTCLICPQNNLNTSVHLETLNDDQRHTWVSSNNCDRDGTDPRGLPWTYPQVCLYLGGLVPKCTAPTTQTCTNTQTCDVTAGCIDSSAPPPASCSTAGTGNCNSDTKCNSQGGACAGYHCIDDFGYIIDQNKGVMGSCAYKPDAIPNPSSQQGKACLKCASKCTANDASGNPYCVKDCGTTVKEDNPNNIHTQYCDSLINKEVCVQGSGCTGGTSTNPNPNPNPAPLPCANTTANGTCTSIATGLGISFPTDVTALTEAIARILLGISGIVALVLIIASGYRLMISQGNPEQVKNAREQLTAAIVGLLFVIFSLVILQVIGYNILGLPGFIP